MKLSEYPYARPDIAALKQEFTEIAAAIKAAASAQEQIRLYDEATEKSAHFQTMAWLAYTRNTINTKDAFYDAEREYLDETGTEKLMKSATFDSLADMDPNLLERLMPLLGPYTPYVVFQKILDGELDYHYIDLLPGSI